MSVLESLRGGLIVSVQAWRDSALDDPYVISAMARAAEEGGAVGVRVNGVEQLRAVRARVTLPMIGLIKRAYPGFETYITPTPLEVQAVIETGCEVVAIDATDRPRPGTSTLRVSIDAIHAAGRLAMADCSSLEEAANAHALGADVVATTLCGYTEATRARTLPALDLVREFAAIGAFVVCEGGVHRPRQVRAALDAGADAVVVGTAITNVDWLVREFAGSTDRGS